MKKHLKTRTKYLRHSNYLISKSVSHVVNLIYRDCKGREFSTSNSFNNPLSNKSIDELATEAAGAVAYYQDFYKGVDLYKDEKFIKLRYKSWMYSEAKIIYHKLPNNHEMKNPGSINDLIKLVTNKYKPECQAEVFIMKEMTEKVYSSAENHNTSTSFSGQKRKYEEEGESSTQPLKHIKESIKQITSNASADSISKASDQVGQGNSLSTRDNRSPIDYVVDKQQSEPFDFMDTED